MSEPAQGEGRGRAPRQGLTVGLVVLALYLAPGMGPAPGAAQIREEPVAVVSALRPGRGQVEVRRPGGAWEAVRALQGLSRGDVIRATGDATATILYVDRPDSVLLTAAASPYTVVGRQAPGRLDRLGSLLADLTRFLLGKGQEEPLTAVAMSRSLVRPLVLVAPRATRVSSPLPVFEWLGPDEREYTLRVFHGDAVLWEGKVSEPRLEYPPDAPMLRPGVRYEWAVELGAQRSERTWFAPLTLHEARLLREDQALLQQSGPAMSSRGSPALLRAALLERHGLYAESREVLLEAVREAPDDRSLRRTLASLYRRLGLMELARQADEPAGSGATE